MVCCILNSVVRLAIIFFLLFQVHMHRLFDTMYQFIFHLVKLFSQRLNYFMTITNSTDLNFSSIRLRLCLSSVIWKVSVTIYQIMWVFFVSSFSFKDLRFEIQIPNLVRFKLFVLSTQYYSL